ncbi:hypothetical protein [Comamonas sp. JC664]|uniref:hypothetical protein n=1 Tax=Comamonas sp. JC664 TaxID=2801917 RepID=UPI003615D9AB
MLYNLGLASSHGRTMSSTPRSARALTCPMWALQLRNAGAKSTSMRPDLEPGQDRQL